jgi:hypothetical protein
MKAPVEIPHVLQCELEGKLVEAQENIVHLERYAREKEQLIEVIQHELSEKCLRPKNPGSQFERQTRASDS